MSKFNHLKNIFQILIKKYRT